MKATLRERAAKDGRKALYLDIYPPAPHPETGRLTRKLALGLTIYAKPRTEAQRQENRQTKALAQSIQAKVQLRLQAEDYGFFVRERNIKLLPFFEQQMARAKSEAMQKQFRRCRAIIVETYGEGVALQHFSTAVLNEFSDLLKIRYSHNTAAAYFTKLLSVIKTAFAEGLLKDDPTKKAQKLRPKLSEVVYLEEREVKALIDTPCENQALKRAVLLSIYTGLRLSDVERLTADDVVMTEYGLEIRIDQQKTGERIALPISNDLYRMTIEGASGLLFPGVRASAYNGRLRRWVEAAGITKHITYHKTRHTCAVSLVSADVDIRVVQSILGHRNINSTMIYAHVIDKKKREALNKIAKNVKA